MRFLKCSTFEEADDGFRNSSFYFIADVPTEMGSKSSLNDVFERKLEHWTQSFLCGDASTHIFLDSLCFVRLAGKFIRRNMKDPVETTEPK